METDGLVLALRGCAVAGATDIQEKSDSRHDGKENPAAGCHMAKTEYGVGALFRVYGDFESLCRVLGGVRNIDMGQLQIVRRNGTHAGVRHWAKRLFVTTLEKYVTESCDSMKKA